MRKRTSQLILELRDRQRWGGRRFGAGRKRGPISRDPHRRRARLPGYQPCHVGAVLSDRFHLHVLRTPREVRHAIAYVLCDARRHAAKVGRLVAGRAEFDPASSGRWFDGWNSAGPTAHDPPTIAAPRTWLLSVGWRRHGLIHVDEIPGSRDGGGRRR